MTNVRPTRCHYYHENKIELETKIYNRKQNLSGFEQNVWNADSIFFFGGGGESNWFDSQLIL